MISAVNAVSSSGVLATGAAVERIQRLTDVIEVEMPVDASQHVIGRDMVVEAEIIE